MVCYVPPKALKAQAFIEMPDDLSPELLGVEGTQLRKQIQNRWRNSEPIQRLLEIPQPDRVLGLRLYLAKLHNEAKIESSFTVETIETAERVWTILDAHFSKSTENLVVPDACIGNANNFMYTWNQDEHYLECEIISTGDIEFFYRQKNTGEIWGEDTTLENTFSDAIFEKVSIFVHK